MSHTNLSGRNNTELLKFSRLIFNANITIQKLKPTSGEKTKTTNSNALKS